MQIEEIDAGKEMRGVLSQRMTSQFPITTEPYISRQVAEEYQKKAFEPKPILDDIIRECEAKAEPVARNKGGRPKIAPEQRKNTSGHYLKVYLKYPTEHDKERIRNIARGINKMNDLRFARMLRIANTESEAMQMVMAERRDRAEYERKYRVWLRRKIKADKELENRAFRDTVKAICRAVKKGKPIRIDDQ